MSIASNVKALFFRAIGALLQNVPTLAIIQELQETVVFDEIPYAAEHPLVQTGRQQMMSWLDSEGAAQLADDAHADYMRLFVGVTGKTLAAPWGTTYITKERLLFSEQTIWVRKFYERYGLVVKNKNTEPDDHIGMELEFLAYLSEQGKVDAAREFAAGYIVPWASLWNADVQKHAKTGFYKALGNMTAGGIDYFMNGSPVS
jgi:TorA maturation chaperone TorD